MEYKIDGFNALKLEYGHFSGAPSLYDFRELDDSNPLMLRAGDPNLKKSAGASLSVGDTFVKGPSAYGFHVGFVMEDNLLWIKPDTFRGRLIFRNPTIGLWPVRP